MKTQLSQEKLKLSHNSAFTLVEISIVIIIIGLLLGGVLGAQSLIKSAKRQSLIKDFRSYETAVRAFLLEYDAIPGDMNNAEDYWGTETVQGGDGTINGNGNKEIGVSAFGNEQERQRSWEHLSLAEVVNNVYQGYSNPSNPYTIPGVTNPSFDLSNKGVLLLQHTYSSVNPSFNLSTNNFVIWVYGSDNNSALLTQDAHWIDNKLDDSDPTLGYIRARQNSISCVDSGEYSTSFSKGTCQVIYILE